MSNTLSNELLAQLFAQDSDDPFLTLITLDHSSFPSPLRFVNNVDDVISRGDTYKAFPVNIVLPPDDGETDREVVLSFDNTSLELIDEIRGTTGQIQVKLEMVLASVPNVVQMSLEELLISQISYNASKVQCKLVMDGLLNSSLTSEKYTPTNFPGLF